MASTTGTDGDFVVKLIDFAKPSDYTPATIKVFDGGTNASFVELPVVGPN